MDIGGVVVTNDPEGLVFSKETVLYLLPNRLRVIRTAFGDNGFRGVRTVTSQLAFLKDLEKEVEQNKETGDFMPDELTAPNEAAPGAAFNSIKEGEFMTVSPDGSLKYLVCNPKHRWALAISPEGILVLCSVTQKTVAKTYKGLPQITVNGIASFI